MSIIMISSEMEEMIGMSDRIVVLYEGRQTGVLEKSEFSQEAILTLASGESLARS
jgi:ABC-type sugar transport system ATPase subunit